MELIAKPKSYFKLPPNLEDYEKAYRSFKLSNFYSEIVWFDEKKLNAAYNAVDRHLNTQRKNKVALYWEGKNGEKRKFTFEELSELSSKFANLLKNDYQVEKGDRVFFFLPRVPELYFGFLGAIKTGAIAGTLFAAFGPQALLDRLQNSGAEILVTSSKFKKRVDEIKSQLPRLRKILVIDSPEFQRVLETASETFRCAKMQPEDPAFMLYTSGTTGKPKGVVHQHLAILHEHLTAKWVLDIHEEDTYWCTADPGWVTGIAYEILGTWSNGAATVVYEGRFDPSKWYQIIEDYKVSVWYTAPTAVRMLAAQGMSLVKKHDLSSLRHLCSVGEPLNPEAVLWGQKAFGRPFHDNYWQTETGGIVIANYPSMPIKPGSMGKPVPGVEAAIIDEAGKPVKDSKIGRLALKPGWPSMMKAIWRRPQKHRSYFEKGWYVTGDVAYKDKDGYFWFVGRDDDVIKTAGERVGPFEVESALISHPQVIEAGVIGKPDPLRGEIIKAFVVLKKGVRESRGFKEELKDYVRKNLAGHAYPREIEFVDKLPKTRSGKIVRRFLKAKELGLPIGDTSTLEEY